MACIPRCTLLVNVQGRRIIAQNHCTILMHFLHSSRAGARCEIYVTDFTASHHKVLLLLCTTKWCLRASGWDPLAIRSRPGGCISPIYGPAQKGARVLLLLLATCAE